MRRLIRNTDVAFGRAGYGRGDGGSLLFGFMVSHLLYGNNVFCVWR